MSEDIKGYVGLDVHKDSIAVAIAPAGEPHQLWLAAGADGRRLRLRRDRAVVDSQASRGARQDGPARLCAAGRARARRGIEGDLDSAARGKGDPGSGTHARMR